MLSQTSEDIQESSTTTPNVEQGLENDIEKEITKLKYYLEETDELIESKDYGEMEAIEKRVTKISDNLKDLISRMEELKIDEGISPRTVRQWKKDVKAKHSHLISEAEKLRKEINREKRDVSDEFERRKLREDTERERLILRERHEQERQMWEEKMAAELRLTQEKLELEKTNKETYAKLPKLKISPFNGTYSDWVRFENMFVTQVEKKPISDEEKFGYLLEMVIPKIRDRISNLRPGTIGYRTAWERLKKEFGHTKAVVNAHMDAIINLSNVKGCNYERVLEFYESLSKNYDAIQTLGEGSNLQGFVMSTLNKVPQIKPDLVRSDDKWEDWSMEQLIDAVQQWLRRNNTGPSIETSKSKWDSKKPEKHWFASKGEKKTMSCTFCQGKHWGEACEAYDTLAIRKRFFVENRLCFNCGRKGHRESECRSRGCLKCKSRHHTSLCDKSQKKSNAVLEGYTPVNEATSLPAIVPVQIHGVTLWSYLDTGSGRNFISSEAVRKLKLKPLRHETRQIVTVNGMKKQSMPVFKLHIRSLNGEVQEEIDVAGANMRDFTTVKRPDLKDLKDKYEHMRDKLFYYTPNGEYPIHLILGDATYCKIKTAEIFKGSPDDPVVEGTTFGWVVHGGSHSNQCLFVQDSSDYEKLYSLDVLGVEDRGENDQKDVHTEFRENITRKSDGRYEVNIPWIPGSQLKDDNETQSRKRLQNVERKLRNNEHLQTEYTEIIKEQLDKGIIEKVPLQPTGERVYYLPHKPVVRQDATTTKVRMVFDGSSKAHPLTSSINDCMYTGPALQPLLWDILVRARMSPDLLLGDIAKAFLQVSLKKEDRDAFRFLFNVNGVEEQYRFTRLPFGAEASPFILNATLQHHYDNQPSLYDETLEDLKGNTYVDNLMKTGSGVEELKKFKKEATEILESAQFPLHKWESNLTVLESENMPNPTKILGHIWDKKKDTLLISMEKYPKEKPVTKKTILSHLGSLYDPLGIASPTLAEGKRIYRDACDEKKGWNTEVSSALQKQWFKWTEQLCNVKIPRSIIHKHNKVIAIHLHLFADASMLACSTVAIVVAELDIGLVKGLLTSKSRISKRNTSIARLELISGHMAANMIKNVNLALERWPIRSCTVWMDSMVALYWISNPGKSWKVFVANRVRKIAESTANMEIEWKYCPTERNLADLGSRGASLAKMEKGNWFTGPEWLLHQNEWPEQPNLKTSSVTTYAEVCNEEKLEKGMTFYQKESNDEWDCLIERNSYWYTLRVTAWCLRFVNNCLSCKAGRKKQRGPLITDEVSKAKERWIIREQKTVPETLETPGWRLIKDETGVLKCIGRIPGYNPIYLEDGLFASKLIRHTHEEIRHLGIANTMSTLRENWWIPRLRSLVKKVIKQCNTCKVFATKPYKAPETAPLPNFRVEASRPYQTTGVDFAGPLWYAKNKQEREKAYILVFTCATSRAVHLEVTKTQTADEFQGKLNSFITRRTRPEQLISDNAAVFQTTAKWIKNIRKSEKLQNYLAKQEIYWRFNLARSPWWGGIYERLIKDIKKTFYKTLGRTHLNFEQLQTVVMDIERYLNNRPLTYAEVDGEQQVLTPNVLMWGQNAYIIEDIETEEDELTKLHRRLKMARQHAWSRWEHEYIHSLMEVHRHNKTHSESLPDIGDIVLVLGDGKNRGEWRKAKILSHIKGKDGVVRGVKLLHHGNQIQRPLQLICPLEIKCSQISEVRREESKEKIEEKEVKREKRKAAKVAEKRIKAQARAENN